MFAKIEERWTGARSALRARPRIDGARGVLSARARIDGARSDRTVVRLTSERLKEFEPCLHAC